MRRLTSPDNPTIKDLVRLKNRRGRKEAGEVLLEGPHLLAEALAAGRRLGRVLFLPAWAETREGSELLRRAGEAGAEPIAVDERLMAKIATTESPPPVVAAMGRSEASASTPMTDAGLILDGLQDPGNVGTILRAAWGAGLRVVWATRGTVDLYAPKTLRAAQGAHFHLALMEWERHDLLARIRRERWWLVAAEAGGGRPFWAAELRKPCLICIGGEASGIDPALAAAADEHIRIPLAHGVDSLNAAVSAGIILFELVRRAATQDNSG